MHGGRCVREGGAWFTMPLFVALGRVSVPVAPSTRHLNILSITMGLVNYGAHMCVRVSTLVDVCVRAACLTGVWGVQGG